MNKLKEIIKAIFTKFSKINMVQIVGIATIILASWTDSDLVSPTFVLFATGLLTLILKMWQSSKELVSTGFSMDWTVWVMGLGGMVMGLLDTWIANMDIIEVISFGHPKAFIMAYLALTIILRTGFTNQSLNSVAERKAG